MTVKAKGRDVVVTSTPVNERTPLLQSPVDAADESSVVSFPAVEEIPDSVAVATEPSMSLPKHIVNIVFPVLLIGIFLANADGSIVIATNQHIASEFDALSSAAWLLTSYILAHCASQSLYGKISDIYGRKSNLAFCWTTFTAGCLCVGVGQTFWQVIVGRAISGIGAAGMIALTSIVITDLVPLNEVAKYRAYVNVTATVSRSMAGPAGAWLAGNIGWRWCFIAQCPVAIGGLALVLWKLPGHHTDHMQTTKDGSPKLARVDFLGAFTLVGTILSCLLLLDLSTKGPPWYFLVLLGTAFILCLASFITVEKRYAKEPILPLELLAKRDVLTSYLVAAIMAGGQFGLIYGIPIYFQIAGNESVARAGSRIVPVVIGNATGTIVGGYMISKTGRYKALTIFGQCLSITCFTLMAFRWHGHIKAAEALYVSLAGYGIGTIQSTTFVHLAARLDHSEVAIAGSTWFLAQSFGALVGASASTSVMNGVLKLKLEQGLKRYEDKDKIIHLVTLSVAYIRSLPNEIRQIVSWAYISSLVAVDVLSIAFVACALVAALAMKERPLMLKATQSSC